MGSSPNPQKDPPPLLASKNHIDMRGPIIFMIVLAIVFMVVLFRFLNVKNFMGLGEAVGTSTAVSQIGEKEAAKTLSEQDIYP